MIITTKKRTKKQNRDQYKQSLPAIRAKARRRLKQMEANPQPAKSFSLDDLSPELKAKLGLDVIDTNTTEPVPPLTDVDLHWNN